jgi:hypothetical protein
MLLFGLSVATFDAALAWGTSWRADNVAGIGYLAIVCALVFLAWILSPKK